MIASIKINTCSIQFIESFDEILANDFSVQELNIEPFGNSDFIITIKPGMVSYDTHGETHKLKWLSRDSIIFENQDEEDMFERLALINEII